MKKIIVFQHVAHKILGILNPVLREHSVRIRYVNFEREPDSSPKIDDYNALIVLGGQMGVYEADRYSHIKTELKLIEEALKKEVPILGICLGAQLLSHVLGSPINRMIQPEVGWRKLQLLDAAKTDPLFSHFSVEETIFQLHGDCFETPKSATLLASSKECPSQAFSYNQKAYGLQFHLEVDQLMIERWMQYSQAGNGILNSSIPTNSILTDTQKYIDRSVNLGKECFLNFMKLTNIPSKSVRLCSR